jgi:hypothetical protein
MSDCVWIKPKFFHILTGPCVIRCRSGCGEEKLSLLPKTVLFASCWAFSVFFQFMVLMSLCFILVEIQASLAT